MDKVWREISYCWWVNYITSMLTGNMTLPSIFLWILCIGFYPLFKYFQRWEEMHRDWIRSHSMHCITLHLLTNMCKFKLIVKELCCVVVVQTHTQQQRNNHFLSFFHLCVFCLGKRGYMVWEERLWLWCDDDYEGYVLLRTENHNIPLEKRYVMWVHIYVVCVYAYDFDVLQIFLH